MKGEDLEQATLIQWCNLQSCKYSEWLFLMVDIETKEKQEN